MGRLGRPSNDSEANSPFGPRAGGMHHGTDWGWGQGDGVCAMAAGVVSEVRTLSDYGRIVRIDHGPLIDGRRTETRYCHLSSQTVKVGQQVARGQDVGVMGNTGSLIPVINGAKAKHLHSELWLDGVRVDEQPYQREADMAPNTRTVRPDIRAVVRADTNITAAQVGLLAVSSSHLILGWKRGQAVTAHGITTDAWFQISAPSKDFPAGTWSSAVGWTDPSTAGIADMNPPVPPAVGATRAEVEAIVKASEAHLLAAIQGVPAAVVAELKKPGN